MANHRHVSARVLRVCGLVALTLAAALLLTGCMKYDMDLIVSEDNTISGTFIYAFDPAVWQEGGGDPEDLYQEPAPGQYPASMTVELYDDSNYRGYEYGFQNMPLETWNSNPETRLGEVLIRRVGDEFKVSGTLELHSTDTEGEPLEGDQLEWARSEIPDAEIRIKLTFPGKVEEGTGDISGNSITWEPDPEYGMNIDLQATASAIPSSPGMSMWVLGVVVLLIVIVGSLMIIKRRGEGESPAVSDGPEEHPRK